MNDTKPETTTDAEAPPCWPPLAHLFENTRKVRPGDKALCGAKLMGIDLEGAHELRMCRKCVEIAQRIDGGGA